MTKKELAEELYKHFNDEQTYKRGFYYSSARYFDEVAYELLLEDHNSEIFPYVCVALASKDYPKKNLYDKVKLYNQAYDALIALKEQGVDIDNEFFKQVETNRKELEARRLYESEYSHETFYPNSKKLIKGADKITKDLHFHDAIIHDLKFDISESTCQTDVTLDFELFCVDYKRIIIKFHKIIDFEFYEDEWRSSLYVLKANFRSDSGRLVFYTDTFARIECEYAEILLLE